MSRPVSERSQRRQEIHEIARAIRQGAQGLRSDGWWDKSSLDAEINMLAQELEALRLLQIRWEESL